MKTKKETTIDKNKNCPKRTNPNVNIDKLIKPKLFNNSRLIIMKPEVSMVSLKGLNIYKKFSFLFY